MFPVFALKQRGRTEITLEICYQFKYPERNNATRGFPWSMRNTEVYNSLSTTERGKCFWLILHPMNAAEAQLRIETEIAGHERGQRLEANPVYLHLLLLTTYIDNWRDFLSYLGEIYQDKVRRIAGKRPS
jgi:hypothetical protein